MAKVRSPNYPQLDLGAALVAVRKAYDKDHRNKMSQTALAKHLGHESLSGPAYTKIGALRAFGLVEGTGDELRVTDDAVTVLMAPGGPERSEALKRLALKPGLFQEIQKAFATLPSPENLEFWLIKRNYTPTAAKIATKSYLASMRLAAGETEEYESDLDPDLEKPSVTPQVHAPLKPGVTPPPAPPKAGMLQEVFNLDEGPVTFSVPATLSPESYQDMADRIEIFLRGLKRRSDAEAARRHNDRDDAPE